MECGGLWLCTERPQISSDLESRATLLHLATAALEEERKKKEEEEWRSQKIPELFPSSLLEPLGASWSLLEPLGAP